MHRAPWYWAVGAVILAAGGCSMCAHPYDTCGPVCTGGCDSCSWTHRAGSVLGPEPYCPPPGTAGAESPLPPGAPEAPSAPPTAPSQPAPSLPPTATPEPAPLAPARTADAPWASPADPQQLPATGWTARAADDSASR
jgi:hypothetical protein